MTDIGVALFGMLMLDDDNRRSVVAEAPGPVRFTLHRLADTGLVEKRQIDHFIRLLPHHVVVMTR